jgi:large subunit ribosomal protein L24
MRNYNKMSIKKDDLVMVITGKDKGKTGKVLRVVPSEDKVIVSGVNVVKKHQKPSAKFQHGGIIEKEAAFYRDKVMLVCPKCNLPTRTSSKEVGGQNVRICKKCEEIVDNI